MAGTSLRATLLKVDLWVGMAAALLSSARPLPRSLLRGLGFGGIETAHKGRSLRLAGETSPLRSYSSLAVVENR